MLFVCPCYQSQPGIFETVVDAPSPQQPSCCGPWIILEGWGGRKGPWSCVIRSSQDLLSLPVWFFL